MISPFEIWSVVETPKITEYIQNKNYIQITSMIMQKMNKSRQCIKLHSTSPTHLV